MKRWIVACAVMALLGWGECLRAEQGAGEAGTPSGATANGRQTETDEYTRYELLAPESASFRIRYEVTATTAGAKYYYNPIRKGSVASDEAVYDAMTGQALQFEIVSGEEARKDPLMADADLGTNYIKVHLARPVPKEGQGRLIILKTYKDAKSYYKDGDAIVFNRGIVYFLKDPESHAFRLYHDYTESRPGVDKYLNVVRVGSTVSEPSAYVLDTEEKLETQIMTGAELALAKIDVGEPVAPTGQVVVVRFTPVKKGQSIRLRIWETYTTVGSYRLEEEDLVFDRSLGCPRDAVVLPEGWYVTASAIPATVSLTADGRVRLDFWNGLPDPADVLIKGKRRVTSGEKKQ